MTDSIIHPDAKEKPALEEQVLRDFACRVETMELEPMQSHKWAEESSSPLLWLDSDTLNFNALLLPAVFLDNDKVVELCLARGADLLYRDGTGRSSWHYASGHPRMVHLVASRLAGVKAAECRDSGITTGINERDFRGWTPLHIAVCKDFVDAARLLLSHGADPHAPLCHNCCPCRETPANSFPIHFAAMRSNMEMTELLLLHGASLEDKDDCGRTALHYATARGDIGFIRRIAALSPSSVHAQDCHQRTPLHVAALRGFSDVVQLFVEEYQARVVQPDVWDLDPYALAMAAGHVDTAAWLLNLLEPSDLQLSSRYALNISIGLSAEEKAVLEVLVAGLRTPDVEQIARCVRRIGTQESLDLFKEALEIHRNGLGRPKSPRRIFVQLVQERVRSGHLSKDDWTYIKAVSVERERAKRRVSLTVRQAGRTV